MFHLMNELDRHSDPEELERFAMGDIASEEAECLENHLLFCEACRVDLMETEAYLASMRRAAASYRKPKVQTGWSLLPLLAAGCCLVGLLSFTLRWSGARRAPLAVSLTAMRANGNVTLAGAGRELQLHPDLTGLIPNSAYRLEMVDRNGRQVWRGELVPPQNRVLAARQRAGTYFIRVYAASGELLREYALQVQ